MNLRKILVIVAGLIIGSVGGYVYWYFWGCENGCTIKSSWWKMSIYGAFIGYLIFDSVNEFLIKRKQKENGNI